MKPTGSGEEVSLKSLYPLIPKGGIPIVGDIPEKSPVVWAIVRCASAVKPAPKLKTDFFIVNDASETGIPMKHRMLEGKAGEDIGIFLFEVDLAGLSPGTYNLVVVFTDERNGMKSVTERSIRIVTDLKLRT
jgi:hypothetical protein